MMVKNIKKVLKYLSIFTGAVAIILLSLYIVIQIPEIQTYIAQKATIRISRELKSTISIGKVEFEFFNRLIINDLLIKDQNNDTLIYVDKAITGIRRYTRKDNSVHFGRIYLIRPEVALITDTTGIFNLKWYLDKIKGQPDTTGKKTSGIRIDMLELHEGKFSINDLRSNKSTSAVNLKNLKINKINGTLESFVVLNDTARFTVSDLSLAESSGFSVRKMDSDLRVSRGIINFNNVSISCDSSTLNIPSLEFKADNSGSFQDFLHSVRIKAATDNSVISSHDLRYFVPAISDMHESVKLSGRFSGTVSELRGRNIRLAARDLSTIDCDFDISGLPDISNAYIYLGINRFTTNATDLEKIVLPGKKKIEIPKLLYKLGNINFEGSFTGFTTDFVTYGEFTSENGSISTDLSMRPVGKKAYKIKGLLKGNGLNLGEITDQTDLMGMMDLSVDIDGNATSMKNFAVNLSGHVDSIEMKEYIYRNIELNGLFTDKTWDGSININDRNIKMDVLGLFNFEPDLPEFDFTLNIADAKLHKLNLDKNDTTSSATLLMTANFSGSNIDNIDGEIRILNSNFVRHGNNLELYDLSIKTSQANNIPVLSIRTDFLDADIKGEHNFSELGDISKYVLSELMPSRFKSPLTKKDLKNNNFSYRIMFRNTDEINQFLRTGFLISENSIIEGDIYPDSLITLNADSRRLSVFNNVFSDFSLRGKIINGELKLDLKSRSFELLRQSVLDSFTASLITKPDNFEFGIHWGIEKDTANNGEFLASGQFKPVNPPGKSSVLNIQIEPSEIIARNKLWKIDRSSVLVDSSAVKIFDFKAGSNEYFYSVGGSISQYPADTLNLEFRGIDITPVNYLIVRNKANPATAFSPEIKGKLNGKIFLNNLYKDLLLKGNLSISNFRILGTEYGTLDISSTLDNNKKEINITAANNKEGQKSLGINGFYNPSSKYLSLTGTAERLSINPLNMLLKAFASDIKGSASGEVTLTSRPGSILLDGALLAENSELKIDYLQTKYKITDSVRFDSRGINFSNVRLSDERGNNAILNGNVFHRNFKNFTTNLSINMENCMVLNTRPKDNDLFYGTAFATGVTTIKTAKDGSLAFDISAGSGRNTRFYIPLNTALSVSEASFVTFIDSAKKESATLPAEDKPAPAAQKTTGMDINMDLAINPEAEVQLIFDMTVGDVMRARGSGDLNISLDKKGDFRINGDYIIEDGDYLFTLQNILNKPFSVENGGRIIFNGDVYDADIDLKAIYKLRASLADILPDAISNERVPVECQINLSGKLFNPKIGFDIYLPTTDEKTRATVRNAIATEEQMSRQFLYLLVMNSFYPDPAIMAGAPASSGTAGTAAAVTTSEMLFSQLSNMLSKISNDFDIGLVYRPGVGNSEINNDQLEVALSKQILNDKVVINGNFDVRGSGNDPNTNQITGDFDAEVKITEKIRFKVFNRYNNPYTGKTEPYTQGVGVFFRQDFNRISDLFKKKNKSDIKKEEETEIRNDDKN